MHFLQDDFNCTVQMHKFISILYSQESSCKICINLLHSWNSKSTLSFKAIVRHEKSNLTLYCNFCFMKLKVVSQKFSQLLESLSLKSASTSSLKKPIYNSRNRTTGRKYVDEGTNASYCRAKLIVNTFQVMDSLFFKCIEFSGITRHKKYNG